MSIEEVRTLVAERQRYDDWLTALEAKRDDTPLRVYERVHGDYVGRRGEVIAQLQSHVGSLSTLGSELEGRLRDLEARLAEHEEELAEGMLRNLVGEYDGDRWESVRQDVEHKIEALGQERAALASEVEDVQTLLASARTAPVADDVAAAEVIEVPESEVAEPEPVEPVAVREPTPAAAVEAIVEESVPVAELIMPADELEDTAEIAVPLAFASEEAIEPVNTATITDAVAEQDEALLDFDVSGLVENPVPQGARHEDVLADVAALFDTSSITAVPEPSAPVGAAPTDRAEFDDALAMFGESTSDADAEFLRSLDGIVAEHDAPPRGGALVDSSTATATPPAAPNTGDPFDDLAFLRSVIAPGAPGAEPPAPASLPTAAASSTANSNEPQKTLRCTECSTMNLPTEWYCERCGGELAAF